MSLINYVKQWKLWKRVFIIKINMYTEVVDKLALTKNFIKYVNIAH